MNTEPCAEAMDFEQSLTGWLAASGGFEHVQRAELDPNYRVGLGDQLGQFGTWDLDAFEDQEQAEAAAMACRAAGRFALPYPLAERIASRSIDGTGAVDIVCDQRPRVAHADLDLRWSVMDLDGRTARIVSVGPPIGGKLGRFVSPVELGAWSGSTGVGPMLLTLQTWTLLGMLQAAQDLTCSHVRDRVQFGKPLAAFQSVQFALTDIGVATQALQELCKYTLWAVRRGEPDAITDAVALRAASLEAAETTFRIAHQLHGAIGFCDESSLSWLSRYSQALRRLPRGRSHAESLLAELIARIGFYSPLEEQAHA